MKNPGVFFVSFFFQVPEKLPDTVPAAVGVAVPDEVLGRFGKRLPGAVCVKLATGHEIHEILLAHGIGGGLEGADTSAGDTQAGVRDHQIRVDVNNPAETVAGFT